MRAVRADLQRVQRQARVVDRARGRGHVVDEVHRPVDLVVVRDVRLDPLELRAAQVLDVLERACFEVVHTDHAIAAVEKVFAQVGAEKAGATRDQTGSHALERSGRKRQPLSLKCCSRPVSSSSLITGTLGPPREPLRVRARARDCRDARAPAARTSP